MIGVHCLTSNRNQTLCKTNKVCTYQMTVNNAVHQRCDNVIMYLHSKYWLAIDLMLILLTTVRNAMHLYNTDGKKSSHHGNLFEPKLKKGFCTWQYDFWLQIRLCIWQKVCNCWIASLVWNAWMSNMLRVVKNLYCSALNAHKLDIGKIKECPITLQWDRLTNRSVKIHKKLLGVLISFSQILGRN